MRKLNLFIRLINLFLLLAVVQTTPISKTNGIEASVNTTHRHSLKELEPDLASSIFNNGIVKNPLSRTTKIPLSFQLDAGNTNQRKRRSIGSKQAILNEYDTLSADFLMDEQPIVISAQLDNTNEQIKDEKIWKAIEMPSSNIQFNIEDSNEGINEKTSTENFNKVKVL